MTNLSLTYSFWWILLCILVGGLYAWIQYSKEAVWSPQLNYGLAGLRWLLVTFLCFLLLEPYLNSVTNYFQKPLFVVAIDNSTSIISNKFGKQENNVRDELKKITSKLESQGFDVALVGLGAENIGQIDLFKFNYRTTDLASQLNNIKKKYANYNVAGMVLLSDGIFNKGYSPLAISTNFPVYTLGLGDTSNITDLAISKVVHNSTLYEGNSLMLEIQSLNTGFKQIATKLKIKNKGKLLATKKVIFNLNEVLVKTIVSIPISGAGKQSLHIELMPVVGELTVLNNKQTIYVDVIDAKKKILIIAASPHPDIKAIKSSIEKNEYYKVDLAYTLPLELDYDLIIAHQYPSTKTSTQEKVRFTKKGNAKWMIIGGNNDYTYLQNEFAFSISGRGASTTDLVKPLISTTFNNFSLSDGFLPWILDVPPLSVPFGLNVNNPFAQVFLRQQIGSVATEQPLMVFAKHKEANLGVLLGTNSWKWKLDEYRLTQSHQYYNELVSKTVQYLSADQRKKRFYVAPQKLTFEQGEDVLFNTQEYNALYEQITGGKVALEIIGDNGYKQRFSYVPLSHNSVYKVRGLAEGVYSYKAQTQLEGKNFSVKGQFIVKHLNLELLNAKADFDLLQKMAAKSNGKFYPFSSINNYKKSIEGLNPISTIYTTQKEEAILNFKWLLILLLVLATTEWFLRKFYGGY